MVADNTFPVIRGISFATHHMNEPEKMFIGPREAVEKHVLRERPYLAKEPLDWLLPYCSIDILSGTAPYLMACDGQQMPRTESGKMVCVHGREFSLQSFFCVGDELLVDLYAQAKGAKAVDIPFVVFPITAEERESAVLLPDLRKKYVDHKNSLVGLFSQFSDFYGSSSSNRTSKKSPDVVLSREDVGDVVSKIKYSCRGLRKIPDEYVLAPSTMASVLAESREQGSFSVTSFPLHVFKKEDFFKHLSIENLEREISVLEKKYGVELTYSSKPASRTVDQDSVSGSVYLWVRCADETSEPRFVSSSGRLSPAERNAMGREISALTNACNAGCSGKDFFIGENESSAFLSRCGIDAESKPGSFIPASHRVEAEWLISQITDLEKQVAFHARRVR